MTNRERFCTQAMYLCFAAGFVVLLQGLTADSNQTSAPSQQLAYRGSGRIELPSP